MCGKTTPSKADWADPLTAVRQSLAADISSAAKALGVRSDCPPDLLRFRPDGKGGELATPFPKSVHLGAALLAEQLPLTPLCQRIYPSGDWLAFDLSELWRDSVRSCRPPVRLQRADTPPVPDFPARIEPDLWRLDALAGITDPSVAARRDRGNPAWLLGRAAELAAQNRGGNAPCRRLVNEAALCLALLAADTPQKLARQLIRLSRSYLAAPAEDALIAHILQIGQIDLLS